MMLRGTELGLFLLPFALFLTWLVLGRRTPASLVWAALTGVLLLAIATLWLGLGRHLPGDAAYVPAQWLDNRLLPAHGAGHPP
ncbi:MAG: hypothetical protein KGJ41_16855 [Rhodospirillales bacterium]|nr:hypothetical protein [Rhodospirillales bacterium]MDE2573970.1 hypothetical protein [Rhodospirillales bacterium]